MSIKLKSLLATAGAALPLIAAGVAAPASAATTSWQYQAGAGATYVRVIGQTVSSDVTAQSSISGYKVPNSATNSTAAVSALSGAVKTGAVQSSTTSAATSTGGIALTAWNRTAGVNLLNGLITADAVETTARTVGNTDGTMTGSAATRFVNLHILGIDLPVDIKPNTVVSVPKIATISLNHSASTVSGSTRKTEGWALSVTLLAAYAGAPSGATIVLNPSQANLRPGDPQAAPEVGGYAYATQVNVQAGDVLKVQSGPTARVAVPQGGSDGKTITNSTAGVSLPNVAVLKAVSSSTTSTVSGTTADVVTQSGAATLDVLSGLVAADAIDVRAHGHKASGAYTGDMKMTTVNLTILGQQIPVNVSPNTTIEVPGIAKIVLNEQIQSGPVNKITGIHITLLDARGGLAAGAQVEVATAVTWIH
ncbi:choice-of-anchor P family protein [Nocardioides jiangxiensis]|uniref:Choice-of-anchor P family protein n=1 Tax=Nocardioides jiangxiensis TaxID=3064524 RepID=A0ABT9AY28_9ACTN|nr:choice-of-anchor P family protein [Nocardioides sp. WY-20]MDO7867384.1 choice-of-anchor P family protein [Nocardioides sp. WY-20]